jgi:decaprenylphospho-beta-D-erythro-pentofuranosid-2-ulose 2-reductase
MTTPSTPSGTLLLVGGTSGIGRATALAYAARGWAVELAGRNMDLLTREADDLRARHGVGVTVHAIDILASDSFATFLDGLPRLPDVAVCVVGFMGDQSRAQIDLAHAVEIMRANYEGPALLLGLIAERMSARGTGAIVGVSSVAGDRGRGSNYVYGSAKAGFTAFLSGLRNRMAKGGIHVLTVKPGFVRTSMTAGMKLPGPITADPAEVGEAILRAVEKRRDVIYVRPVWWMIMTIICSIPERLFKKLSL